ncbi:protein of unknown function [Candidatus Filomicrobium marinum]|uniref:Uncharacterized protein n=1 Tax=Candidatus Filomicrobium marinum TaxID=1608628 RepID=A0A0D6JAZ8_9HYPH|nr:hypothetical protein [Candidatus Filomicrobium marinum]CFX04635.1 protein of unknown function [Candidatus Filomicrobium marinum]CPR16097.1 protein of unknown function [Candidatus Filomicrobium marinum]
MTVPQPIHCQFETSLKLAVVSIRHSGGVEQHNDLFQTLLRQANDYDAAVGNAPFTTPSELEAEQTPPSPPKRKRRLRIV